LGSRIGPPGPTAQRPEVLDANAARRILVRAEKGRGVPVLGGCAGFAGQARSGRAGRCPPRASMASAISASGERNPNASRVSSRILVLVDSINP
jgi:hypothetical protein